MHLTRFEKFHGCFEHFCRYICSKTVMAAVQIWTSTAFSVVPTKLRIFMFYFMRLKKSSICHRCSCSFVRSLYIFSYMLERRENQDLLFGDLDDRLSVSFIRSLPSWLFRVARFSPNRAVSGLSPHKQTRAAGRTEKKAVLPKKDGSMLQTTRVLLSDSQNRYSNTGQNSTQLERKINREVEIQLAIEA